MSHIDLFNKSKNYAKILFKARTPVQAGELNEMQSIMSAQVSRFGDHIYKPSSRISNARASIVNQFLLTFDANALVNTFLEGTVLTGNTSGQKARFSFNENDTTLIFTYEGTNLTDAIGFQPGEDISAYKTDGSLITTLSTSNQVDFAKKVEVFYIDEGVFYFDGYFLESPASSYVIHTPIHDGVIGFKIDVVEITPNEDPTLLDNNFLGASYQQEGADRLAYSFTLFVGSRADQAAFPKFISIVDIKDGLYNFTKSSTDYSKIGDMLATRTYEESGNYTVRGFKLELLEHKAASADDALGFELDGLESNYVAEVGPGIAYTKGYRYESSVNTNIIAEKARNTEKRSNMASVLPERASLIAVPVMTKSVWPGLVTDAAMQDEVILYDGVISTVTGLPTGSIIGKMVMIDAEPAGNVAVAPSPAPLVPSYKYYYSSLELNAGKNTSHIKSLFNSTATFAANLYFENGVPVFNNVNSTPLIWEIEDYAKSLRSIDNSAIGSIMIFGRKRYSTKLNSTGVGVIDIPAGETVFNNGRHICTLHTAGVSTAILPAVGTELQIAPSKITFNIGAAHSGKDIHIVVDNLTSNLTEKRKEIRTFEMIEATAPGVFIAGNLNFGDIISLKVELVDTTNALPTIDITSKFTWDNGVRDYAYIPGRITKIDGQVITATANQRIKVSGTYYHHIGNQGFFTVDSYVGAVYGEIPSYQSAVTKTTYNLRRCIDFRPLLVSGQTGDNFIPAPNKSVIYDAEIYLGRYDYIAVLPDNKITLIQGEPAREPIPKVFDESQMILYRLKLNPYVFSLSDIAVTKIDNRRYTMRDIARLDSRLTNVETYTSLNLLEKSMAEMSIKDVDGFDRFKNGFIADNFADFQAGDVRNVEFRAAISPKNRVLSPLKTLRSAKLILNEQLSSGFVMPNNMAMLPYSDQHRI